jgi:uncharacterized protein (TIGR03437 family)
LSSQSFPEQSFLEQKYYLGTRTRSAWFRLLFWGLSSAAATFAQVNVLNVNYDLQQTGANLSETILTPQYNWNAFGKTGTFPVDGEVYAQPLYVSGVAIGGTSYNVLYVATMHNSVYAFNADTPQNTTPLWQVNLGPTVPSGLFNFTDILPEVGILGTPAIDATKQVLYVVADTQPAGELSNPVFQLHALSLLDGHEMYGGPMQITASVPGTGAGSANGTITFDAFWQLQRPGLILNNGTLYIGFGSHSDAGNYQGWILAYNSSTLAQTAVFNSAPNGRQAAFWQSGRAPAIDTNGDVYAVTGNGDWDGTANFGESLLRLSSNLSLLDWYTPQEYSSLNAQDQDLGSAGAILIPNTHLLLTGGKAGMLYVVQDNSLGHLSPDVTSTVQGVQVNSWGLFNMALWNGPSGGPIVYEFEPGLALKAYQITGNQLNSTILSQYTPDISPIYVGLSVSANGGQNGLVWLITADNTVDGDPATLHALDASNLARELWNSANNVSRDQLGAFVKFAAPTVANGHVYVPTLSNAVVVYGTLSATQISASPAISAVVNSASYLEGAVAPGELVTIFGANLGPPKVAQADLDGDFVSDNVENTQVLIGGLAAPILYASSTQINAVVPFGVTGATATLQVLYQAQSTASTTVQVQDASPAVFSMNSDGGGQGAVLNQDGTVNSQSNPASRGSVVAIYATGAGLTSPASQDGLLTTAPYPQPMLPVSVSIAGLPATVQYVGAAPGLVAGVIQINAVVPAGALDASYNQVVVTVGNYVSPSAVTIVVQ